VKAGEKAGYPRFKGMGWYDSFTYPQSGFALDGETLQMSKIGNVKIKLHRAINGEIKQLNIKRSSTCKKKKRT
jgi:putative transposase